MLRKIGFSAVLILFAGVAAAQTEPRHDPVPGLRAGDVLFKGASTAAGTRIAAGWSLGDKRWGHVGIVLADADGGFSVIHADPGAPRETGEVRRESLAAFLSDVTMLGHYGVALEGAHREAYLRYAEGAAGLPFDRGFSLNSDDRLYCSEFVWRALSAGAGEDILPEKSERFGRVYVSVSDLSEHPLLTESSVVTAGPPADG